MWSTCQTVQSLDFKETKSLNRAFSNISQIHAFGVALIWSLLMCSYISLLFPPLNYTNIPTLFRHFVSCALKCVIHIKKSMAISFILLSETIYIIPPYNDFAHKKPNNNKKKNLHHVMSWMLQGLPSISQWDIPNRVTVLSFKAITLLCCCLTHKI